MKNLRDFIMESQGGIIKTNLLNISKLEKNLIKFNAKNLSKLKYIKECLINNIPWNELPMNEPECDKFIDICDKFDLKPSFVYELYRAYYNKQDLRVIDLYFDHRDIFYQGLMNMVSWEDMVNKSDPNYKYFIGMCEFLDVDPYEFYEAIKKEFNKL